MARGTTTLAFVGPTGPAEPGDGTTASIPGPTPPPAPPRRPGERAPEPEPRWSHGHEGGVREPDAPTTTTASSRVRPGHAERRGPTTSAPPSGPDPQTTTLAVRPSPRPRRVSGHPAGVSGDAAPDPATATVARVPHHLTRPEPGPAATRAPGTDAETAAPGPRGVDIEEAVQFLRLHHEENPAAGPVGPRLAAVREEIARTGTYVHTTAELEFGARIAWRNSARCIGRLYWRSLHLRDRRDVTAPDQVAAECVAHLRDATRRGRIRSTITVFAPDTPTASAPRIWNEQLVRYAGYRAGGTVLGDPRYVGFTDTARSLGWTPPSPMGAFDVLPLVVSGGGEHAADGPQLTAIPPDAVMEVALSHPDHDWFVELGLRWHAVPAISNMRLDIGGVSYPAAPFNGWYMATEIGARNFADPDRYDMLGAIAERMGLDTSSERTLWRDRAAVELTLAVQHSFDTAGVSLADHHGESQRFLRHVQREEAAGRSCPVDWSWIVPPISGGLTPVFHRYYDEPTDTGPMFRLDDTAAARGQGCPV